MKKLFRLKGRIQNYAWGGKKFLPELLGIDPRDIPYAEYWMGAHTNAPSMVLSDNVERPLDEFLREDPDQKLGSEVSEKFGRLPFLFKVLDVHDVLSIQVHPSKREAEKGFRLENEKGIPLTASNRNYKDDNHKPEIMVALSDFWLLHGFLPEDRLMEVLRDNSEFSELIPVFEKGGYKGLYKYVMELSAVESDRILKPLVERITPLFKSGKLSKSTPDFWAAKAIDGLAENQALDKGIFSIYFFNILKVPKGEAVFQDAGVPHAYLEGQNMELMANSDNVLRGGLTPKHIDVSELLRHIVFEATHPNIMSGTLEKDGKERIYHSPAPDFQLSGIALTEGQEFHCISRTTEIFIVIEGSALVAESDSSLDVKKGEAFLVLAGSDFKITTEQGVFVYRATTPC